MTLLGLDLGGTHAACSLINGQTVLATEHLSFPDTSTFAGVLPDVTACLKKVAAGAAEPVSGLGIGMCGLVDSSRNRVLSTNGKYEDTVAFDFERWGRESLGMPVRLENDARLALRGEMYAGAARGFSDVVMFTLGTGIGGVAAMNGAPLIGKHGQAGVLGGHIPVRANGRRCTCGGQGCAETEASGWWLPTVCREWPGFAQSRLADRKLNFKTLFELSAAGDRVAVEVRDHCLTVWGMMTVAAVHSFDPELVVFGGGAMGAASQILPALQAYVDQNTWTPWGKVQLVAAELGNHAAALGVPTLFDQRVRRDV
jgi:glucokinase